MLMTWKMSIKNKNMTEEKLAKIDYNYDDIIAQAKEEIRLSRDYVREKRIEFRDRLKLYNNQRKQKDKIGDTSIFNVMNTMLAVYYSDEMQVTFSGRDMGDVTAAANTEDLAKFDYEEMGMDVLNYLVQWDRFFFGVGIRQLSGWNKKTKTPIPKSLNPLTWLPDPSGHLIINNFRWNGFEVSYNRSQMTPERGFINLHLLKEKSGKRGTDSELTEAAYREAQGLDDVEDQHNKNKNNISYDMVDQFMEIKGSDGINRKFLVTFDDEVTNIFRFEEIKAITAAEKEDPSLVPFPLALNYYSPNRTDPFGTSVPDLVEDKQRAKSVFKNLQMSAAKADIYPMYMYNRDKILNRRDLDFAFNKFIAVRGDVGDTVVRPLNKSGSKLDTSLNVIQALDGDIEISTGIDKNASGVLSDQQRTLGEVQQTTANANLRFLLGSKINAWGERRFWKLWYRLYKQNFAAAEKKVIRLKSAMNDNFIALTRKDFISINDPDIKIGSKLEMEQNRLRDRAAFAAVLPIINGDPTKPIASKRYAERHLLRLYGISQEEINVISPKTPDEMKANMENELLNRNNKKDVEAQAEEDHLSHIVIHGQAEQTPATVAHINAHKQLYFETGQAQMAREAQMQMQGGSMQNIAANQLANQNSQQSNSNNQTNNVKAVGETSAQ